MEYFRNDPAFDSCACKFMIIILRDGIYPLSPEDWVLWEPVTRDSTIIIVE